MKTLRPAEQTFIDYGKHEKTKTMVHEGGTSLEWLMYHAAAAAAAADDDDEEEDGRDKGERVR